MRIVQCVTTESHDLHVFDLKHSLNLFSVTSAPLTAAQLKSPPLSQPTPLVTITTQGPVSSLLVKDGVIAFAKPTTATSSLVQQPKMTTVSAAAPSSMTFPYYLGSLPKFAHPVLVTSLMAPAVGLQASSSAASSSGAFSLPNALPASTPATNISSIVTVKSDKSIDTSKQFVIQNNSAFKTQSNITALTLTTTALKTVPSANSIASVAGTPSVPIRQVFAPGLLPGQLAWPLLTLPRSPVIVPTTSMPTSQPPLAVTTIATSTGQVTSHPLVSLANLNHLAQMMTPMTVMSPGIQMTPSALTQAQLNGVFGTPLLKQLQLPLGIQTVLGQQVVKPVVMVTVPSVTATTSASLPSSTALVTSSL